MDIEGIKDAVYELEGLLELADLREDKLPALLPLMRNKLEIINALFETPEEEDYIEESEDTDLTEEEDEESVEEPQSIENEVVEEISTVTEEYGADFSSSEPTVDFPNEEPVEESEDEPEEEDSEDEPAEEESEEKLEEDSSEEEEEAPVFLATDDEEEEEETPAPRKQYADPNAPKPAFCINDRFRFRRELFNNSDSDFNAAMDLVATMDDYDEAEDYFIGELGWDFEKPEVMDFMAIIRNYFEK